MHMYSLSCNCVVYIVHARQTIFGACIHSYVCVCVRACVCVRSRVYVYECMYVCGHACLCRIQCVCICKHIHTNHTYLIIPECWYVHTYVVRTHTWHRHAFMSTRTNTYTILHTWVYATWLKTPHTDLCFFMQGTHTTHTLWGGHTKSE